MTATFSMVKARVVAAFLVCAGFGVAGCMQHAVGVTLADSRRFEHRPGTRYRVVPVAHVDETVYGLNVLGFAVRPLRPVKVHDAHLTNPDHYVTNWQVLTGTIDAPYMDFLVTIPYSRIIFDVVSAESIEQ